MQNSTTPKKRKPIAPPPPPPPDKPVAKMLRFDQSEMKGFDDCLDLLPGSTENAKIKWLIHNYPRIKREMNEAREELDKARFWMNQTREVVERFQKAHKLLLDWR